MISRRALLAGAAALGTGLTLRPAAGQSQPVRPRSDWGADLPPVGPLEAEAPGDVRFLLVHHTAGSNDYGPGDVPAILRGIYRVHTTTKAWPDVAYNFFVDRFGVVWEGRTGSLAAPIKADATGGSQGFAQLCCLIGTFTDVPPTAEAHGALVGMLAQLADTYGIDTRPGSTTTFISRGSNRWPTGATVTAATIAGHRDMSLTACPGDAAYQLVADGTLAREASARRAGTAPAVTTTAAPTTTSTTAAPTTTTPPPATSAPTTATTAVPTTTVVRTSEVAVPVTTAPALAGRSGSSPIAWVAAGLAAAAVAAAVAIRRRPPA